MITAVTYSLQGWALPYQFELEAKELRVRSIARVEEIPEGVERPHFVPWFLTDMLAEADPAPIVFIAPHIRLTPDLLKTVLQAHDSDMATTFDERFPTSEVIFLSNQDITRELLDAWIQCNDENPLARPDDNLGDVLRRHRSRFKMKKLPREVLHDRSVACTIPS